MINNLAFGFDKKEVFGDFALNKSPLLSKTHKIALINALIEEVINKEEMRYKAISGRIENITSEGLKDMLFKDLEVSYNTIKRLRGLKC